MLELAATLAAHEAVAEEDARRHDAEVAAQASRLRELEQAAAATAATVVAERRAAAEAAAEARDAAARAWREEGIEIVKAAAQVGPRSH